MLNMRGLLVKDINPNWPDGRYNQTGRVVRATKNKIYWISDVDGAVVIDSHEDMQIIRRTSNNDINMGEESMRRIKPRTNMDLMNNKPSQSGGNDKIYWVHMGGGKWKWNGSGSAPQWNWGIECDMGEDGNSFSQDCKTENYGTVLSCPDCPGKATPYFN